MVIIWNGSTIDKQLRNIGKAGGRNFDENDLLVPKNK